VEESEKNFNITPRKHNTKSTRRRRAPSSHAAERHAHARCRRRTVNMSSRKTASSRLSSELGNSKDADLEVRSTLVDGSFAPVAGSDVLSRRMLPWRARSRRPTSARKLPRVRPASCWLAWTIRRRQTKSIAPSCDWQRRRGGAGLQPSGPKRRKLAPTPSSGAAPVRRKGGVSQVKCVGEVDPLGTPMAPTRVPMGGG